jgi:uncharacterized protein
MRELEARLPCPVCLGASMEKLHAGDDPQVVLDHCPRCGGIWVEQGEAQRLRGVRQEAFWQHMKPPATPALAQCHNCHAPVGRDAVNCPACGFTPCLACPACQRDMHVVGHDGVSLDVCTHCRGVWFDRHEIASIWTMERDAALQRRRTHAGSRVAGEPPGDLAAYVLIDSLFYAPELVFLGGRAAGQALTASADALGAAPEVVVAAAEVAGEAAEGVFSTILEIIGGLFG